MKPITLITYMRGRCRGPVSLTDQQRLFTQFIGILIQYAYACGYGLTFGDAYRDPLQTAFSKTLHAKRLAVDFNLFKDGQYLVKSDDYKFLGDFWKALNPLCCWGGDFKPVPDGNHFSMTYGGVK